MSSSNGTLSKIIPISVPSQTAFKDIIGQSPSMKKIFRIVEKAAVSNTTIMLNGETGTGKGVIARAIHECSSRRSKPFIQINCGATPEGLLESEFFGYRRGAFTGAVSDKQGKFEMANGGTIFLDEIGDMSADLQVKVLRVLEEGEFERIGGHETIKADARVIAATHRTESRRSFGRPVLRLYDSHPAAVAAGAQADIRTVVPLSRFTQNHKR
jgi:transcriptional regulator with GAF, ATPase, and Fis domain